MARREKNQRTNSGHARKPKLTPEVAEVLRRQIEAFTIKFGRAPGPHDPLFFDPDEAAPRPLEAWKVAHALNPFVPPIRVTVTADKVLGHAKFGASYEGFPGHVHGGFLALAFDHVLEKAQALTGNTAMTATLTVHYRKPTPLFTDLQFEAVVDRVEGRKVFTRGTVSANGAVTAEGEGLFIAAPPRARTEDEAAKRRRGVQRRAARGGEPE